MPTSISKGISNDKVINASYPKLRDIMNNILESSFPDILKNVEITLIFQKRDRGKKIGYLLSCQMFSRGS